MTNLSYNTLQQKKIDFNLKIPFEVISACFNLKIPLHQLIHTCLLFCQNKGIYLEPNYVRVIIGLFHFRFVQKCTRSSLAMIQKFWQIESVKDVYITMSYKITRYNNIWYKFKTLLDKYIGQFLNDDISHIMDVKQIQKVSIY